MPIITIQITREIGPSGTSSLTSGHKAALIKGATKLMQAVLNKPADATFVIITEVEKDNRGWGGLPIDAYRTVKP